MVWGGGEVGVSLESPSNSSKPFRVCIFDGITVFTSCCESVSDDVFVAVVVHVGVELLVEDIKYVLLRQ